MSDVLIPIMPYYIYGHDQPGRYDVVDYLNYVGILVHRHKLHWMLAM